MFIFIFIFRLLRLYYAIFTLFYHLHIDYAITIHCFATYAIIDHISRHYYAIIDATSLRLLLRASSRHVYYAPLSLSRRSLYAIATIFHFPLFNTGCPSNTITSY